MKYKYIQHGEYNSDKYVNQKCHSISISQSKIDGIIIQFYKIV